MNTIPTYKAKHLFLLIALLFSNVSFSQTQALSREVKRMTGKVYLSSSGSLFEIRETVLLAKLKEGKTRLSNGIKEIKTHSFGMIEIAVPDSVNIEDYYTALEKSGDFEVIEYDTYPISCMSANDYYYYDQWAPSHIHADAAWEITTGSPSVKVAVIEQTGFQLDHPDLYYGNDNYSNLSVSEGVDYVSETNHTPTGEHGTMVAGVIAAKTNNSAGIAGIAGGNHSPGARIIPYRISSTSNIISAVYDAYSKGAKVINMSFVCSNNYFLGQAITYAYNNGITVVCGSGKTGTAEIGFPASHQYTIAVGAVNSSNFRASESNYGEGLDLVAPGTNIRSTAPESAGYYYKDSGTSYATPHVTGVIALMLSVDPTLTPATIRTILRNSATKIRSDYYSYNSIGWNSEVGYGLLDAFAALLAVSNCSISGPSCICSSSSGVYTVDNLPSSFSVLWNFTDGFGTCTSSMYMSGHTCTIVNSQSKSYMGTLTANIYDSNANCLYTLKKENVALYSNFYGTCTGGYMVVPDLQNNGTIFVSKGSGVILKSPNFVLKNISHSVTNPATWQYDSTSGEIYVVYPNVSTNNPILINVQNDANYSNCDNSYTFAIMPNTVLSNYALSTTVNGREQAVVTLANREYDDELKSMLDTYGIDVTKSTSWTLDVFNATTSRKVLWKTMTDKTCVINIADWEPGLYIVKAVVGETELTEKMLIK